MTRTLTLKNRFQGNTTVIENDFIDNYIAKANGEYVKVYLMLLRHLGAGSSLSISGLADCLECTEKDILRAFKYWTKVGLLKMDYDDSGNICGLAVGKVDDGPEVKTATVVPKQTQAEAATSEVVPALQTGGTPAETLQHMSSSANAPQNTESETQELVAEIPNKKSRTRSARSKNAERDELRLLYHAAQCYIGKLLTPSEMKKINYFYDELGFSFDLIDYLIAYCVDNGHRTFRYIESVALAWSDSGIQTVEQAKERTSGYTKNCFAILGAYGIKGRNPAPVELDFIKKWTGEYGFTLDIILEACNRTINNTHKPDFKYTDSILASWLAKGVHHLSDITLLDLAHREGQATKARNVAKPASNNRFNNFEGRSYDMTSLEQQLLKTN